MMTKKERNEKKLAKKHTKNDASGKQFGEKTDEFEKSYMKA